MTSNKNYLHIFKVPIIIIMVLVLGSFGWGVYNGYSDAQNKSGSIIKALENNCDCKSIEQSVYLSGIQFGKDEVTREKGSYQLVDCKFESFDEESERIVNILKKEVRNLNEIDYLELEFINNDESQSVIIKNGIIQ